MTMQACGTMFFERLMDEASAAQQAHRDRKCGAQFWRDPGPCTRMMRLSRWEANFDNGTFYGYGCDVHDREVV